MTLSRHSLYCFAVAACFALTAFMARIDSLPLLAMVLFVPLAVAFRDTWAGRALLSTFLALGALVRRELSIDRVRANAWLNPA